MLSADRGSTIGQHVEQIATLIDYCARMRQALQTFDATEKRRTSRVLDLRVTWTPGLPPEHLGCDSHGCYCPNSTNVA
jgi:hypothetical protein